MQLHDRNIVIRSSSHPLVPSVSSRYRGEEYRGEDESLVARDHRTHERGKFALRFLCHVVARRLAELAELLIIAV